MPPVFALPYGILLRVSDEPKPTYSAREIVLELFPATDERLIPGETKYQRKRSAYGDSSLRNPVGKELLALTPVTTSGSASTQVCCDFCQRSAPRHFLQLFRVEVPASGGRRYCYVSLCRDVEACELRRLSDEPIRALLARVFP